MSHTTHHGVRILTHLGFGLVTYGVSLFIFFYTLTGASAGRAVENMLSPTIYLVILSVRGWQFATPALILAGVGLFKRQYVTLNRATVAIASLILVWNALTIVTGGTLLNR